MRVLDMRVNPDFYNDIVSAVNQAQAREQVALEQVSSGRRVSQPSDDPAAFAAWANNTAALSEVDQFQQNVATTQSLLNTADSTLSSVVTGLNQAITLGVEGANGSISDQNRQEIAQNVSGIRDQMVQLANLNFQGVYVFAGTANRNPPFALDSAAGSGVQYSGNDQVNTVQIGDGRSTAINLPGDQIFTNSSGNVMGSLTQLINVLQSGTQDDIAAATTAVRSALDQVSQQRTFYGTTLNSLQQDDSFLSQENVNLKSNENTLVGVDLTQAATNLTAAQTAVSATLEAAAKVLPMSILDYLH